jgi:NitT/TauT family transport system substrate-binding protein
MKNIKYAGRAVVGRPLWAIGVAAATVALASGCGSGGTSSGASGGAKAGGLTTITILPQPHASMAPLYIALQKGYFKQEGLDVKLAPPASPAAAYPALATGKLDIMYSGITSGATAVGNGLKLKMIAQMSIGSPRTVGIVTSNPSIRTGADLAGKTLGSVILSGSTCILGADAALKSQGVEASKLKWVELPPPAQGAAMQRGDIDGACAVEPTITMLKQQVHARLIVDSLSGQFAGMPADGLFVRAAYAQKDHATIEAFLRALGKGTADAKADPQALRKVIEGYSQLPARVVDAMAPVKYVTGIDRAQVQRVLDAMKAAGLLRKPLTVDQLVAQ